jgi:hypothetical protein
VFQYVWASEEYVEFVGTEFNDIFAFIICDSADCQNLKIGRKAVISIVNGTNVAINSVNPASNADNFVNNVRALLNTLLTSRARYLTS